ncbi:MAG: hypothetical protein IJA85_10380 [Clostridia bacterium]|nr:hypothetical protein [Clostridia bacterium]
MLAYGVPAIGFFENKNIYTGSSGDFRFRIAPDEEGLTVSVWLGKFCYEKSEMLDEAKFDKTEEGLETTVEWVLSKQQSMESEDTPDEQKGMI